MLRPQHSRLAQGLFTWPQVQALIIHHPTDSNNIITTVIITAVSNTTTDFPRSPVVKTLSSQCQGHLFHHLAGEDPACLMQKKKEKKKKKSNTTNSGRSSE